MEWGQGERCGCDHLSEKPAGARLKYQYPRRSEELDSSEYRPCAQPEDQERFDQAGGSLLLNPDPGPSTSDCRPLFLWRKIDDVALHID